MFLLERLKTCIGGARGSTGHRLVVTALILSWKAISDDTYSNRTWAKLSKGLFNLRNINRMERDMCVYLGWRLHIDLALLSPFEARMRHEFHKRASEIPSLSPSSVSIIEPVAASRETQCDASDAAALSTLRTETLSAGVITPSAVLCGSLADVLPKSSLPAVRPPLPPCLHEPVKPSGSPLQYTLSRVSCSLQPSSGSLLSSGYLEPESSLASIPGRSMLCLSNVVSGPALSRYATAPTTDEVQSLVGEAAYGGI